MKVDKYEATRRQLKKDIKKFLREQENYFYSIGACSTDTFDEDTNEGYANILLNRALNLI